MEKNMTTVRNGQETNLTNSKRYEDLYLKTIIVALAEAFQLAGRVEVTMDQVKATAVTWTRYLFDRVPIDDLDASIEKASSEHKGKFVLTAYEIHEAYKRIVEERELRAQLHPEGFSTANGSKAAGCAFAKEHVKGADVATVRILHPFKPFGSNIEVDAPCKFCRPKAYDDWRQRLHEKSKAESVDPVAEVAKDVAKVLQMPERGSAR